MEIDDIDDAARVEIQYSKCYCTSCISPIEFPSIHVGETVKCPHCGASTVLVNPETKAESSTEPRLSHDANPEPPPFQATKKCPYCAEEILRDAIKCKHCGEHLVQRFATPPLPIPTNTQKPSDVSSGVFWGLFKFFILLPIAVIAGLLILTLISGILSGN